MKLCTKNYENPSIFVKVTAKKSVAPFFLDTVYILVNLTISMAKTCPKLFDLCVDYTVTNSIYTHTAQYIKNRPQQHK